MTTLDITRVETLAQQSYEFVCQRFADHTAPIYELLDTLGIDHSAYIELERTINGAIAGAEHAGYVAGFTFSAAIANLPVFTTDPMDAVLMPDRYVGR